MKYHLWYDGGVGYFEYAGAITASSPEEAVREESVRAAGVAWAHQVVVTDSIDHDPNYDAGAILAIWIAPYRPNI